MSDQIKGYHRARNSDSFDLIQHLSEFYGVELASTLLGIRKGALRCPTQPIPVVRLAFLLHRLTFPTGEPLTVFEILTCGKYEPTPQELFAIRAKRIARIKDFPECFQVE